MPAAAAPGADPVALARRAEDLGFDFVSTADHPGGDQPTHETWTMLFWIAARTSRIRVATRVLGLPYRHPPMVAKAAEALDRLSGGRLILGLGGGSADDEFRAFGLGVPSPREKVDALAEAIMIMRPVVAAALQLRGPALPASRRRPAVAGCQGRPPGGRRRAGPNAGVSWAVMTWTWQLEAAGGTVLTARGLPAETFASQSDAESWLGENWRGLLDAGVDQVTLLEDGRTEYGPMSLHPAE